jgi:hypothetical protein
MRKKLTKKNAKKEIKPQQKRAKQQNIKAKLKKKSGVRKKGEAVPYLSAFFSVWGSRV